MGILSDPRRYLWQWELDAPPASLWPLVANTDRFNRDTGLPPVEDLRDGHELAPGRRRLRILVDATGWRADAATSAEVLVLQEFRDLFNREVLSAGRSAGVGTLTILFTDIKGSTALYRTLGDGPAFDQVADHFRLLRDAIEPERGSVVKTIGGAVMAAFLEPAGALRAALRAHAALARAEGSAALVLKASLHADPCIAVPLNERLDYFGSTVNVAARLAGLSQGADIVTSETVRDDPGVTALLVEAGIEPEGFRAPLRGIEDEMTLWRVSAPA